MKLLVGFLLSAWLVQAPLSPSPPSPQTGTASVSGRAVKWGTNDPLADVTVDLVRVSGPVPAPQGVRGGPAPRLTAVTGDDGGFTIKNVPAGEYRLYGTSDNGYIPGEYGQRTPTGIGTSLVLADGKNITAANLALTPTASVSGRVTDANGDPSVFTSLLAFRIVYKPGGARKVEIVQSVLTDDQGNYRLYWLPPGKIYISAMPIETRSYGLPLSFASRFGGATYLATPMLGYRITDTGELIEETWVPVYYPGTTDILAAKPLDLHPGEQVNAFFSVAASPTRTWQIRGVVLGDAGQPLASANLTLVPRRPEGHSVVLPQADSDENGVFTIHGVVPGAYYLFVIGGGSGVVRGVPSPSVPNLVGQTMPALTATISLDVGKSNVDGLKIPTARAGNLSGHVVFEGRAATNPPPRINVSLVRDPELQGAPSPVNYVPGNNGAFTLSLFGIGDYRVNLSQPPPNTYVKSIRMGATNVLNDGLHVAGPTPDNLEIVVAENAGTLSGVVLDNKKSLPPTRQLYFSRNFSSGHGDSTSSSPRRAALMGNSVLMA